MWTTIVRIAAGFGLKRLLIAAFKEIVIEFAVEWVQAFAADTDNPYDDQLAKKFADFVKRQLG